MFDKWKAKRELVKAFKFYRKKYEKANKHYHHTFDIEFPKKNYHIIDKTYNDMKSLEDIVKALAYVLYSNFYMFGGEDGCWVHTYYDLYKNDSKEYIEKITKQNKTNNIAWSINDFKNNHYTKGDKIYNTENGCVYFYDGKNFINMC